MMVAVENMAMPDRCLECRFCQEFSCVAADVSKVPNSSVPMDMKKPDWCPLRKVDTAATMYAYSKDEIESPKFAKNVRDAQERAAERIFAFLKQEKAITFTAVPVDNIHYVKAQLTVVLPPQKESGGISDGT